MNQDRYGSDVLARDPHPSRRPMSRPEPAVTGLVVEEVETGWCGAVVAVEKMAGTRVVVLEDRRGRRRSFPLGPGFWIDGEPVALVPPPATGPVTTGLAASGRTASGSRAVPGARARVARASRIWVEGRHDAELVERVWGDDLRLEGIVVELLDGADNLPAALGEFRPGPERRAGVLLDHLVPGSKESRIAAEVARGPGGRHVLVLGHPYVDVWQAVRPERVGLAAWPEIPRGQDIKTGTLRALGWPASSPADVAAGWQRIVRSVRDYRDLEPSLLGRVEELVDFVTGSP